MDLYVVGFDRVILNKVEPNDYIVDHSAVCNHYEKCVNYEYIGEQYHMSKKDVKETAEHIDQWGYSLLYSEDDFSDGKYYHIIDMDFMDIGVLKPTGVKEYFLFLSENVVRLRRDAKVDTILK